MPAVLEMEDVAFLSDYVQEYEDHFGAELEDQELPWLADDGCGFTCMGSCNGSCQTNCSSMSG